MHPLIKVVEPPRARPVTKLLAVIALGLAALPGVEVPAAAVEPTAPIALPVPPPPAPPPAPAIEPARPRVMRSGAPACGNVTGRALPPSASRRYPQDDGDPACTR